MRTRRLAQFKKRIFAILYSVWFDVKSQDTIVVCVGNKKARVIIIIGEV